MFHAALQLKLMYKFDFLHYILAKKMFRKPILHVVIFILEFVCVSYGYVLLHNMLSTADVYIDFSKSVYFTVISASTVGYGDHYPVYTLTRWYVIILMILYLPFRFFYVAGVTGFLFKSYRDLKQIGRWFPMLHDHVIVYCNAQSIQRNNYMWLERFIKENRISLMYKNKDIVIINGNQDANTHFLEYFSEKSSIFQKVHFINANLNEQDFFQKIHIDKACKVYVLADEDDMSSDSDVFDMVYRIDKETAYENGVTAELVNDNNRERIEKLGANVILRPNRSMPEMLITCTIAPGAAHMLEEIVSRGGDSIERFSLSCSDFLWGDLLYQLNMHGIGTATAVIYEDETVDSNPIGTTTIVAAKAILVLVHEMNNKNYEQLQESINTIVHQHVIQQK